MMRRVVLTLVVGSLLLPLGCSREEAQETAEGAKDATEEAAEAVKDTAEDAADAVSDVAASAAAKVDTVVDPVGRCLELSAQSAWADALEPCTKAHEERPNDLAIEHALQQARAAAGATP